MAATIAVVGFVIGTLLGVAGGRRVWTAVVAALGIPTLPEIRALAVAGVGLALLVASLLLAVLPARQASGARPAVLLRQE